MVRIESMTLSVDLLNGANDIVHISEAAEQKAVFEPDCFAAGLLRVGAQIGAAAVIMFVCAVSKHRVPIERERVPGGAGDSFGSQSRNEVFS